MIQEARLPLAIPTLGKIGPGGRLAASELLLTASLHPDKALVPLAPRARRPPYAISSGGETDKLVTQDSQRK